MKLNHFITSQKILTFAYVLILMARFNQWQNITAWIYLSLHGTYGFLWALKSHIFPDKNWERKTSLWYGLVSWAALSLYWITPWLITSKGVQVQGLYLAVCISLYIFGVFLHLSADMQKYTALKLTPGYLITDGLLARSPNDAGVILERRALALWSYSQYQLFWLTTHLSWFRLTSQALDAPVRDFTFHSLCVDSKYYSQREIACTLPRF